VALLRVIELRKHNSLLFMNLFMHKNNGGQLKLNIKLNWKITNTTPIDLMNVLCHSKKVETTPFVVCEFKLIILHKCVHNHY
jgi:hypothetical protein